MRFVATTQRSSYAYDEILKQWNEKADAPAVISNVGNQGATYDGSGTLHLAGKRYYKPL